VTNPNKETRQTDAIRPQFARQPAVAIRARTPQFDLVELDLYCVERLGGNRTVFRKKRKRFGRWSSSSKTESVLRQAAS